MIKNRVVAVIFICLLVTKASYADLIVKSPNGNTLIYSQEKKGENYNGAAWGKVTFLHSNNRVDLSVNSRYYISDDSSAMSPSGNYYIINSVASGMVTISDGTDKYTDKAYCSIIDMKTGCIVSDLDGWVCSYKWVNNKDILAESDSLEADKFDFLAARPSIKELKKSFSLINEQEAENILRCDAPNENNISSYHNLLKENKKIQKIITKEIINYLTNLPSSSISKDKANLFAEPNLNSKMKAYLISGDKVKIIRKSTDNKWINIGYINKKGTPFISWIEASDLQKIK